MRFDDATDRGPIRIGGELGDVGDEKDRLQEIVDAELGARRDRDERRVAAVLLDRDVVLGELCLHLIGVRVGLVHLVQRDDDRYARGLHV